MIKQIIFHDIEILNRLVSTKLFELKKDAVIYIASQNEVHGDIKPGNILVSERDGRLRAFLGDFGLTGKSGGTPIFMAPEGLDKDSRITEKTDLYSFAITVLLLMLPYDLAIKLLFIPIGENLAILNESLSCFPLLPHIFQSLRSDPKKRIDFDSWKNALQKLIRGLDLLKKAVEKEAGINYYIQNFFGFDTSSGQHNETNAYKLSSASSQLQNLSLLQSNAQLDMISKGFLKV